MKYIFIIFACAVSFSSFSAESEKKDHRAYAIHQQWGSTCHLYPFINYQKISQVREREDEKLIFQDSDYLLRFDSFSETFPALLAWQLAMTKLYDANGEFRKYQKNLIDNGIISSQIFKEDGTPFSQANFNPIENFRRKILVPYHFIDLKAEGMGAAYQILPMYLKNGDVYLFNNETKSYDKLKPCGEHEDQPWIPIPHPQDIISKKFSLSPEQKEYLSLGDNFNYLNIGMNTQSCYGFDCTYVTRYLPEESMERQYYMVGLYQLILFAHGVDNTNQQIGEGHSLFEAFQEFSSCMREDAYNPWYSLDKNIFLEYRISQVLNTYPDIKNKVLKVIDTFLPGWAYYRELMGAKNSMGRPLQINLLPNEDQMLAYYFSMQVRFLWAAAVGQTALNAVTSIHSLLFSQLGSLGKTIIPFIETLQRNISMLPLSADEFRRESQKKIGGQFSFLDVWQSVLNILIKDECPLDFTSFSGHGCVISCDRDLIGRNQYEDTLLARSLGFVVFDSDWARQLNLFYMKQQQ